MKYLKRIDIYNEDRQLSSNIVEIDIPEITDGVITKYKNKYPNKWILYNKELGYIWIKDKPKLLYGYLPKKVYHVSNNPNLDKIGIKPSSELDTPFGYINFTFFYLSQKDAENGSIPYMKGENFLYEIDTNIPNIEWYEGFNEPIDGEENITTNNFIPSLYVKKIIFH